MFAGFRYLRFAVSPWSVGRGWLDKLNSSLTNPFSCFAKESKSRRAGETRRLFFFRFAVSVSR